MAAGRSQTPLFDLIREADRAEFRRRSTSPGPPSAPAHAPTPPVEPKPISRATPHAAPAPAVRRHEDAHVPPGAAVTPRRAAPEPAADPAGTAWFDHRRTLSVSLPKVYAAAAVVLAGFLVVWLVAYQVGYGAADRKLQPYLSAANKPDPPVVEPLTDPQPPPAAPKAAPQGPSEAGQPPPAVPVRVAGSNYLILAGSLPREDAEAAVAFLKSQNFPAALEPVDRRAGGANNRGRFEVFSTLGIPGSEYSKQWKLRGRHAEEAKRLGEIWKREHKGSTDFAQAYWARFSP